MLLQGEKKSQNKQKTLQLQGFSYSHLKQFLLCRRWLLARLLRFLLDGWRVGLQAKLWRLRPKITQLSYS